jgi:hypothetical protein
MKEKKAVGRPNIENKRVTLSMRIKPEFKLWLESFEISKGAVIERLIQEELSKIEK